MVSEGPAGGMEPEAAQPGGRLPSVPCPHVVALQGALGLKGSEGPPGPPGPAVSVLAQHRASFPPSALQARRAS